MYPQKPQHLEKCILSSLRQRKQQTESLRLTVLNWKDSKAKPFADAITKAALSPHSSFAMTVECNYAIAIATLSDWLKQLATVFQAMRSKTKPIVLSTRDFSRALSML